MKQFPVLIIIMLFTLSGCYVADSIFIDEAKPSPPSLQKQSESAVTKRIKSQLNEEEYEPYGFTEIKIIKPKALVELEELEKKLRASPNDSSTAILIAEKKEIIRDKRLESQIKIDHIFTLSDDTSGISIFEIEYTLNDTLAVKNVEPKILLKLASSYDTILSYYFNEYTIFRTTSYSEGRKLSRSFFRYYKTKLEEFTDIDEKSNFLKHALNMSILVKKKGEFDQSYIKEKLFEEYIIKDRPDISNYNGIRYSDLYETRDNNNNSLLGYYYFHEFIGTFKSESDTNVVLVEMNPYYQIGNVFQLTEPFEVYTNQ